MPTNNSNVNTVKTTTALDDAALAVVRSTMTTITGIVIKNGYSTTKAQKNMLVGWCESLELLDETVIQNDIKKGDNYRLAIEACQVWLENQGIKTSEVKPVIESSQAVSTVISKPVKKADQPSATVGFDHLAFFAIIDKMVETKRLHGDPRTKTAKVIKLELAYQVKDGSTEFVTIKQTQPKGTAKDPGSIYIHINDEWCLNVGTANTNHQIKRNSAFDFSVYPWLDAFLADFIADPASVAAKSGKLTKRCCVCSLKLDDPKSLSVGYGKKCASNMGWQYGASVKEIVSGEVALTQAVQAIEAEKCEIVTEVKPEVPEPIHSDAVTGIKAILKAYHNNPRDGYQGLRHAALATVPSLRKQAKAQVYLDALYEWLDSQPSVAEVPVETVAEVAPVPIVDPTPVQVEVPVTPVTEQPQPEIAPLPVEASQPTVKLSEQSQAVLDSVKPHVTPERYAELYLEMLRLEGQAVKPKKTRKPSGTGTPKAKKDPSVMVNEIARLCQIADEQGMDQAFIESGKTDSKYMPRAYRSYRHIYQQSEVIRDLVDTGKLAWGSVHHYLAGRNPLKCGIPHLEDFAVALSQGLWIENPTPLNPRPKAYNKAAGELPPQD